MSGRPASPVGSIGAGDGDRRYLAYVILGGLAALLVVIIVMVLMVVTSVSGDDKAARAAGERAEQRKDLPVYWTVRRGDTYVQIAQRTGLTIDELLAFNPRVDPATIQPGQRLKLRAKVPRPQPKPLGPKWVTLRAGDSFGSVAAKAGVPIGRLQRLNPKLKATSLQPGDRVRLR